MKELFLISSSYYQSGELWAHCLKALGKFMGEPEPGHNRILFMPYAKADGDYDGYTKLISAPFEKFGYEVVGMHTYEEKSFLKDKAICAVCVGGGNTWLLANKHEVIDSLYSIKNQVMVGDWKYISASAGSVMACESMITTNDMCPVQQIKNTKGFGLIPFQINPHFVPGSLIDKHKGETREERIKQVILHNPDWQVVGLPEACWIEIYGDTQELCGNGEAIVFSKHGSNFICLPWQSFDTV